MIFTPSTPRESATFQGFKLLVPVIFPEPEGGDALLAAIAAQSIPLKVVAGTLQQIFALENPRNNVSKAIKSEVIEPALLEAVKSNPEAYTEAGLCKISDAEGVVLTWDGKIESIPDTLRQWLAENFSAAAQAVADAYYTSYQPGLPKRRGAAGPSLDPVEDLARKNYASEVYAGWKETIFTDMDGKRWTGIKSQDRENSAHRKANEMLAAGTRPAFMSEIVFEKYDGEIADVAGYVEAMTSLLFADDNPKPAGKAKAERLRNDARATLQRIEESAAIGGQVDDLL